MSILVTGGEGQLGASIGTQESEHEIILCSHDDIDIRNYDSLFHAMKTHRPDAVINCAAWADVDGCEKNPDHAFDVNAKSVEKLREVTEESGCQLVQISTDYVFDGEKKDPYIETDEPNPISVYGQSKLLGEQLAGEKSLIVRTSWLFSRHSRNILETILDLLDSNENFYFVNDQIGCPTYSLDLATCLLNLIESSASGIFHVTNQDSVSWYEFAIRIAEVANLDSSKICPISTEELNPPRPAKRPMNSVLENRSLYNSGFSLLRSHEEALFEALSG